MCGVWQPVGEQAEIANEVRCLTGNRGEFTVALHSFRERQQKIQNPLGIRLWVRRGSISTDCGTTDPFPIGLVAFIPISWEAARALAGSNKRRLGGCSLAK
jgi:hypothetical protein